MQLALSLTIIVGLLAPMAVTAAPGNAEPTPNGRANVACERTAGKPADPPFCTASTLVVTGSGISAAQAARLGDALGIPGLEPAADGAVRFLDAARFQHVPTIPVADPGGTDEDGNALVAERFDFEALPAVQALAPDEARQLAEKALRRANLLPQDASVGTGHSILQTQPANESSNIPALEVALDTHVWFDLHTGGVPIVGPGAKLKLVFDGSGAPTLVMIAMRSLSVGDPVQITPPENAGDLCRDAYGRAVPSELEKGAPAFSSSARLVYYAPPLALSTVEALFPHYLCEGSLTFGDGSVMDLRPVLALAVPDAPTVEIQAEASFDGQMPRVNATAEVTGGTPPFTYAWASTLSPTAPELMDTGPAVSYEVMPRESMRFEEVFVTITDANGLTASATAVVELYGDCCGDVIHGIQRVDRTDVGVEYIGTSQGLDGSAGNSAGFRNTNIEAGVPVQFYFGDYSAWEDDFKDPTNSGTDSSYVDDVDMVWYTGHASGSGWTFNDGHDDDFLHYDDARYGNRDLEWLVIAACGPLQSSADGLSWAQRWGPAFDGLHMMMGYATVSNDNDREGRLLALNMHGYTTDYLFWTETTHAMRLRQAWAVTASDVQPSSVIYAMMGPGRADGVSDYNDYFWGRGGVGPDIPRSQTAWYWLLQAPS